MKLMWLPLAIALISFGCEDPIDYNPLLIDVTVEMKHTSNAFSEVNLELEKIRINSQGNLGTTTDSSFADTYDFNQYINDNLQVAAFTVSYDSIQWVEITFGSGNTVIRNDTTYELSLTQDDSFMVPYGRYIQDRGSVNMLVELDASASITETSPGSFSFQPKLSLKN